MKIVIHENCDTSVIHEIEEARKLVNLGIHGNEERKLLPYLLNVLRMWLFFLPIFGKKKI